MNRTTQQKTYGQSGLSIPLGFGVYLIELRVLDML